MAEKAVKWLSDTALEEVLALPGAVLVVFTAAWCVPCQTLMSRLERVLERPGMQCRGYLVDTDRYPEAALKYNVRGMPTLLLFVDGDLEASRVGAIDEVQLETFLLAAP
ncbi:thioredoxin [Modicisalibacter ilicicola DSM 19980]|uniref:Thioredoxin n=1 Tax=Modicisalibacter ilicicola DSM 19980 TaxID=1121942 RepID=A0A1M4V4X3_9GAMM|nr:thioredoxin family protein [Halomonas ilicicola]SHE63947.1 thioredoxin [Halomonas ilicicola DSM 19980]